MARKVKRWAVRNRFDYILLVGNTPRKANGVWVGAGSDYVTYLVSQQFERCSRNAITSNPAAGRWR